MRTVTVVIAMNMNVNAASTESAPNVLGYLTSAMNAGTVGNCFVQTAKMSREGLIFVKNVR